MGTNLSLPLPGSLSPSLPLSLSPSLLLSGRVTKAIDLGDKTSSKLLSKEKNKTGTSSGLDYSKGQ